jgi:hypothetical protein
MVNSLEQAELLGCISLTAKLKSPLLLKMGEPLSLGTKGKSFRSPYSGRPTKTEQFRSPQRLAVEVVMVTHCVSVKATKPTSNHVSLTRSSAIKSNTPSKAGVADGLPVESTDGIAEGTDDGSPEGSAEGGVEGLAVEPQDGRPVGSAEGIEMGAALG